MSERINKWLIELMSGWINKGVTELMSEWMNDQHNLVGFYNQDGEYLLRSTVTL
jgi:hypothetical protein